MKSHTGLRRRLLTLLAGFFGFVITVVLSAIPGTAVAEVIRVGETANAAGTGGSAATVAALDRSRRSKHSRAAPADTPGDRGTTAPSRTSSAGALAVPDEDGPGTVSAVAGRGRLGAVSAKAGGAGPGAAVSAVADRVRVVRRAITAVVAARTVTPSAVFLSAVSLRGPPPHTGS
ncbi:hypothetical protein AB0L00_09525 [Actinoallomurus sp. NPDC052308]|uniref:hypothetical protein n=1 Tax=Actinoallomurus sp. NPDC052308 TaxID=3155530 RepID=UPI0034147B74